MKKTLPMRLLAMALCVAMLATVTPIFASAESTTYLDYNATTGKVDTERTVSVDNVIDEATDSFVTGWNIVEGSVEFGNRITLPKDVNLILADGATLTAKLGITVAEDGDFAVYAQSNDAATMGKLIMTESVPFYKPGIGSDEGKRCGNISIYGGTVTARGGMYAAGIGSGDSGSACGTVTIYGGVVTATGGNSGAGIGSGFNSACDDITIIGGIVTAQGGVNSSGIGSGVYASCNGVTISGGYVKATPGAYSAPIGAGYESETVDVSIDASCTSVTKDGTQYINYQIPAVEPTCTESGILAYFQDPVSGKYYDAVPLTEDTLIGDATALAAWKAESGAGYVARIPHVDENEDDICDVCSAAHAAYLDYNETTGAVDTEHMVWAENVIDEATDSFVTGWNVVKGAVEFEDRIVLPANVKLVLANDATLTAKKGITVAEDGDFAVYAQSNDAATMGKLIVPESTLDYYAGIGCEEKESCGNIAVYGGALTVMGGYDSAAIGSGFKSACGDISIYGGIVTVTGGGFGAGIGSGSGNSDFVTSCGIITISGGVVTAQGGGSGAGIGSGWFAACDEVNITGGYVKATAGKNAEPIGAGYVSDAVSVSIDSSCTSVTKDGVQYINYQIPAKAPTCTESGFKVYFQDPVSGDYYSAVPLTADTLIGDATALAAWKAQGGAGYVEMISHVDENDNDLCDVCETLFATYLDYNRTSGAVDTKRKVVPENMIDEATDSFVSGWNYVKGNVEFEDRIVLPANVKLILANGATLTAKKGITVAEDGDFAVYAQSNNAAMMGKLIVPESVAAFCPGIGSSKNGVCGNIAIYGGAVTTRGGMYGAGIGSGDSGSACGTVTIYGGVVTATAGAYGAGIGSGYDSACDDISVLGGIVTAQGGMSASGIGSGYYSACGDVTISGGIVNAQGGYNGAGIGSGFTSSCGKVTITAGYVKATAGADAETIGAGYESETVDVSIDASCTSVTKDGVQYIDYQIPSKVPTCTESGFKAYFQDPVSGKYYDAVPLTEDTLIGDATALAAWKIEGGAGYLETLPHTDVNKDGVCDVCEAALTKYLDYNATTGEVDTECLAANVNVIDETTDSFVTGWNYVKDSVEFEERITLPANVKLILANGATLTAKKGITVAADGDFAVYAQSNDEATMGKLIVPGADSSYAGIGSKDDACGNIAIYGGAVTAQGGVYASGIGSGDSGSSCGTVTIYGGVITATAGAYGAGIGSGYNAACGDITILGGIVTAQGGYEGAGIGSGYYDCSCGTVTISGGYVKATPGEGAEPIGAGCDSDAVPVLIDASCTSVTKDGVQYVNYEPVAAVEPTCTENGTLAYVKDYVSGNYYTAFPFTEDGLLCDADGFAAWKAEGGDGCVAALGHDWQYVDEDVHECARCEATEAHTGVDDYICDDCGGILLETAQEDAITALNTAAGDEFSDELAAILDTAIASVNAATTIDDVKMAKVTGLKDIALQLLSEEHARALEEIKADAKTVAKSALTAAVGDEPSDALAAILRDALDAVDEAATIEAVQAAEEAGFAAIMAQVASEAADKAATEKSAAEALAEAKGAAKAALDAAANPIGSATQAQVLSDAKAAVDAATTLDGVTAAKADGLSAIAAQKATELATKIAELKADINDNLFPAAKCYEAKDILYAVLSDLDAAASVSEANEIYNTAKAQANDKDAVFADKLSNYKATFPLAITDVASEETEQFVENVQTALDNALSIAALDGIYAENEPLISFHATKDTMLSQCKEILESGENTEAMDAVFEMTFEMLSKTTNMDELEEAYAYCSEQIEMQRERESYLPECEMILASDEYSDEVKTLVREFIEALNAAESLKEIEYVFYDYAPAINLQAVRDKWMAELEGLLPEEPSDAVNAIIEDASELILYGEDSSVFDNVYDIARRSVERQLTAEANTKALEDLFKQTEEALASANDMISALNDTIESKDTTIAEKQAALDTVTEQLNAAKADLETTKAELEKAKADVEELQEALEMAQIALDAAQTGFNKLETTLAQQEAQLNQAQQTVKDLQAEVERLKALLDDDPTDPQPTEMRGDANGDGAVNMKDVLLLRKYLADTTDTMNMENADVNGDGDVNMKDVLMLRKYLAGVIENLEA